MAELKREELRRLARLGAKARLEELLREEAAIRKAFPDLEGAPRGSRGGMSAAARKVVSERMKKYWAERRKSKSR